jgi:hypothetical protein
MLKEYLKKNTGYFVRSMKIIIKFVDMYLINEANYWSFL